MTTPSLSFIRALTKDDWESFAAVRLEALKENPRVYSSTYDTESEYRPEEWQRRLGTEQGKRVFGAFDRNELIGICGVFHHDYEYPHTHHPSIARAVMGKLYIKPAHRHHGLATDVGRACVQWSIGYLPWQILAVAHRDGNISSQAVIRALGFTPIEIERNKMWPDGTSSDQYWYMIDLQQSRTASLPMYRNG